MKTTFPDKEVLNSKMIKSKKASKRVTLLSCPIDALSLEETIEKALVAIRLRIPTQHCVVNAGKFVLMKQNKRLMEIVRSCPIINADGQSVVWALKLKGQPIPGRVTGIDLMERLLRVSHEKNLKIFFFGSTQIVLDKLIGIVKKAYPNLVVAGSHHGFYQEEDVPHILSKMKNSGADILFVAMGSPKKEYWLGENLQKTGIPFCMGVGGSFDVLSGKAKRAPRFFQKIGMEWFYRFIQEPIRLWRRYLLGNFIFLGMVFAEVFKVRFHLSKKPSSELVDKEIT